jgi:hypothetical protein
VPNSWTPDQIKQFQDYWDTEFAGDLALVSRFRSSQSQAAYSCANFGIRRDSGDYRDVRARLWI